MAADKPLTPKQELFIREYLIDLNATQAYKRAGYKVKNNDVAKVMASRLLTHDNVSRAIEEANKKRTEKLELSAEWVLENLKNVAIRCQQAEPVMVFDYKTKEMQETGEYKFDSQGANKALELIGKHLKLFTDNVNLSGEVVIIKGDDRLED
jgi:phage terminase small subunit